MFRVPVTAMPGDRAGEFTVRSQAERVWWSNVRGGAPVVVWVGGRRRTGHAEVDEAGAYPLVSLRLD